MQLSNSGYNHSDLIDNNPGSLRVLDGTRKLQKLSDVIPEKAAIYTGGSILLDKDERELVKKGDDVTKEEMWELLENKRFQTLKQQAVNLQGDLIYNKRCPKCTLCPPCKHYESQDEIVNEANKFMNNTNFKQYMSPKKMQGLNKALQQMSNQNLGMDQYQSYSPKGFKQNNNNSFKQQQLHQNQQFIINDQSVARIHDFDGGNNNLLNQEKFQEIKSGNFFKNRHMRNGSLPATQTHKSLLQQTGQLVVRTPKQEFPKREVYKQSDFLKKGEGRGGIPTSYDLQMYDSHSGNELGYIKSPRKNQSNTIMMPIYRGNHNSSVRIRNKDGSYRNQSQNSQMQMSQTATQFQDPNFQAYLVRKNKAKQDKIAQYKEFKLSMQIEFIEQQQEQLKSKLEQDQLRDKKRVRRGELNAQKLEKWNMEKYQKDMQSMTEQKQEAERVRVMTERRQEYFEAQRRQIGEFRELKQQTEGLLDIQPKQQRNPSNAQIKEYHKNIQRAMAPPAVGNSSSKYIKPPSNNPVYSSSRNLSVQNQSEEKPEGSKQSSSKANLNQKTPNQSKQKTPKPKETQKQEKEVEEPKKPQTFQDTRFEEAENEDTDNKQSNDVSNRQPAEFKLDNDDGSDDDNGHSHTHTHSHSEEDGYSDDDHYHDGEQKETKNEASNLLKSQKSTNLNPNQSSLPDGAEKNPQQTKELIQAKEKINQGSDDDNYTSEKYSVQKSNNYTDYSHSVKNKSGNNFNQGNNDNSDFKNFNNFDNQK